MIKFKKQIALTLLLTSLLSVSALPAKAEREENEEYLYLQSGDLTEGQLNIVRRARQLIEVKWTPIYDRAQWGYAGVFEAGVTYTGVPYGQAVHAAYIGYDATIGEFVAATEDSESKFYTEYSNYRKIAPYYATDCSGFVSYAWGLKLRRTSSTLPEVAELIGDDPDDLEVGDCLDDLYSHALLVTGVVRDRRGHITAIETMEQTPVIARRTVFGDGGDHSLDYFKDYYFSRGYRIYRLIEREQVVYEHDCAVPIDDDFCGNCAENAPQASIVAEGALKVVTLSHSGSGEIYYTVDGSEPDERSERYFCPIYVESTTTLKAVVIDRRGDRSRVLTCHVSVEKAQAPRLQQLSGKQVDGELTFGSTVSLSSNAAGAGIYYTLDGSDPTMNGTLYTNPLLVTEDMLIRAVAYAPGCLPSDESRHTVTVKKAVHFSDIAENAWYANAVNFVQSLGYFNGTGGQCFSPEDTMTRGMFVTVLGRMAQLPTLSTGRIGLVIGDDVNVRSGPGTEYAVLGKVNRGDVVEVLGEADGWYAVLIDGEIAYIIRDYLNAYQGELADLDESKYYSPYVQWAYLSGISRGTGEGSFSADAPTTRQDMAVLLYNYARYMGQELTVLNEPQRFRDEDQIKESAVDAVRALQLAGIVNGMGDERFAPLNDVTRAQVAKIIMSFYLIDFS